LISLLDPKLVDIRNGSHSSIEAGRGYPTQANGWLEWGTRRRERGYDWYVQEVKLEAASLATSEFNGVLADWKQKVSQKAPSASVSVAQVPVKSAQDMTVGELGGGLKPAQLWSVLGAIAALVAGAFALGAKLFGKV